MRINLTDTPERLELLQAIGSKNASVSIPAQEAFAAFLTPIVQKVLDQAGSAPLIYTDMPYDDEDSPEIPLDPFYGADINSVTVWSQTMAGGLASSYQVGGFKTMKVGTYTLDAAVSWHKRLARRSRLNQVTMFINRMIQEVLVKQELNAWSCVLASLAQASTNSLAHYIAATAANVLQLDDFNRILTRNKRINTSFAGGTPVNPFGTGITDLFMSPEMTEQIRGFAYQPMNTRAGSLASSGATAIALPDAARQNILSGAGAQEIYGVGITELRELGIGAKYNILFGTFTSTNFTVATDEILVGVDSGSQAFIRPVSKNSDYNSTLTVLPDDQFFSSRMDKAGNYVTLEESRVCIDARCVQGLVV